MKQHFCYAKEDTESPTLFKAIIQHIGTELNLKHNEIKTLDFY